MTQPTKPEDAGKVLHCDFCGKSQHDVSVLIAGPTVFICDECVELCNGILFDRKVAAALKRIQPAPQKPQGFWSHLFGGAA